MESFLGDSVASPLIWVITIVVTVGVLLVDLLIIGRRPHEPSMKEVSRHLIFFVSLAVLFGLALWFFAEPHELSPHPGPEFFAGWLTEYSLSVDNLFIFLIIMSKFQVPRQYQQTALMIGIVLALIMRAIFILVGAAAINEFSWVFYVFGAFLIDTAFKLAKEGAEDEDEYEENKLIKWVEKRFPATKEYHGTKLITKENGKRLITPMFIVIVALGTNGAVDRDMLARIASTVGRDRDLVLVNAYAPRDWIPGVNRDLAAFAASRTGVVVADWSAAIADHTDLLAGDQIHPERAGGDIFAEVVEEGIRASQEERSSRPSAVKWMPMGEDSVD